MIFWDLFDGVGYLAAEIFALSSLICSVILLFIASVNQMSDRCVFRSGDQFINWSGVSFFASSICVVSLRLSDPFDPLEQSPIFGFRHSTIELLLGLAFIMVFFSIVIRVTSGHQIP